MVQIGVPSDRLIATETGKVRAALLNSPDSFIGEKKGLYTHAYVSLPSQSTGAATTRRFIRENPDMVRKYVRSQIEAVHRIDEIFAIERDINALPAGRASGGAQVSYRAARRGPRRMDAERTHPALALCR